MNSWVILAAVGLAAYLARGVLAPFIVAGVLAYIFSPIVDEIRERTHLPRAAVVGMFYALLVGLLVLGVWVGEVRLAQEVRELGASGPDLVDAALSRILGSNALFVFGQQVDAHLLAIWINQQLADMVGTPSDVVQVTGRVAETLLQVLLGLLALFYLLLDGYRLGPYLLRFVPPEHGPHVQAVGARIHLLLGRYLRGQLFLVVLMSGVTFVMLEFVFHVPYALPLGLMTGVLEVIPLLGPWVAGTIASLVALSHGGMSALLGVAAAYFVLRQMEDQLVMPIVLGRAVHLHPLVTIFAVLVGASMAGVLGAILAVPVAAACRVLLDYVLPDVGAAPSEEQAPILTGAQPDGVG